jgi:ABC-type antimicrobial peptide transport system permease subunit
MVRSIAVVALLLAVVGLYAVTGHTVERWRRELGLRVALGAGAGEIGWLVVRRVLVQLGIGLGVGAVGAQLFDRAFNDPTDAAASGVRMTDPAALAFMAVSIGVIAVLACVPPIRRAARVDPIVALRTEWLISP